MNDHLLNKIVEELQMIRLVLELSAPQDLESLIKQRLAELDKGIEEAQKYEMVAPEDDEYGKIRALNLKTERELLQLYLFTNFPRKINNA